MVIVCGLFFFSDVPLIELSVKFYTFSKCPWSFVMSFVGWIGHMQMERIDWKFISIFLDIDWIGVYHQKRIVENRSRLSILTNCLHQFFILSCYPERVNKMLKGIWLNNWNNQTIWIEFFLNIEVEVSFIPVIKYFSYSILFIWDG